MTTGIEWTDETWNPVTGCSKVSPGCAHCYAEHWALTRLAGKPGYPGLSWTPENAAENVVLHPDRLDLPLRWRKPRRVFVNSMSDLFHERVPDEFIDEVFAVMALCDGRGGWRHTFQVLTKRPERMRAYLADPDTPWRIAGAICNRTVGFRPLLREPDATGYRGLDTWAEPMLLPNVWLGTSIENDRFVGRADALRETPAAVRFISAEPLLGPLVHRCRTCNGAGCIDRPAHSPYCDGRCLSCPVQIWDPCDDCQATGWYGLDLTGIDWLIVGGESGPGWRPMDIEWVRDLVERADTAGCPVFVKQCSGARAGKQGWLPDDLWVRKEYPMSRGIKRDSGRLTRPARMVQ